MQNTKISNVPISLKKKKEKKKSPVPNRLGGFAARDGAHHSLLRPINDSGLRASEKKVSDQ